MTKTYAKGSGSRKARPTPKGEVQTAKEEKKLARQPV